MYIRFRSNSTTKIKSVKMIRGNCGERDDNIYNAFLKKKIFTHVSSFFDFFKVLLFYDHS